MANVWIYEKVNRLILKHKTRDPIELAEAMNVRVFPMSGTKHLLGMYNVIERNRFIFLSTDVGHMKKTIVAHELGHDQLHRDMVKNGAPFQENRVFNPTNRCELEANIFACHLLIADEDVIQGLQKERAIWELSADLDVDVNLLILKISELAQMGKLDASILTQVEKPKSDFLVAYEPVPEDWGC